MAVNLMLALRAVQAALAVLIMGLTAAVINRFNEPGWGSPDVVNFMLFCCIWTFLVLIYICFAQSFAPQFHNQYGVLAAEVVSVIFWFSSWVAMAAWIAPWHSCLNNTLCGCAKAATAFGAFEWVAFMISAYLVVRAFMQTRNGAGAAQAGTEMPATSGTDKLSVSATPTQSGNPDLQHNVGVSHQPAAGGPGSEVSELSSQPDGVRVVRIPSPEEFGGREVV